MLAVCFASLFAVDFIYNFHSSAKSSDMDVLHDILCRNPILEILGARL